MFDAIYHLDWSKYAQYHALVSNIPYLVVIVGIVLWVVRSRGFLKSPNPTVDPAFEHLEKMSLWERLELTALNMLPFVVGMAAIAWVGLGQPRQYYAAMSIAYSASIVGGVAIFWFALFVWPAIRDVVAGKVLVAQGAVHVYETQHTYSDGNTVTRHYCDVSDGEKGSSPQCQISWLRYRRMHRREGAPCRLYIAPHTEKLFRYKWLKPEENAPD